MRAWNAKGEELLQLECSLDFTLEFLVHWCRFPNAATLDTVLLKEVQRLLLKQRESPWLLTLWLLDYTE